MSKWRYSISFLFVLVIDTTIFRHWSVFGVSPSLIVAYLVGLSILHGPMIGGYTGLAFGLLEDIMFSQVLGVRALLYFVGASVVGRLIRHNHRLATGMLVTSIFSVFTLLGHWLFLAILRIPVTGAYLFGLPLGVFALENTILFPFVWWLLRRFLNTDSRQIQSFFLR